MSSYHLQIEAGPVPDSTYVPLRTEQAAMQTAALGWWLTMLGLLLIGYALFGKAVAYLGVPPLFVGEVVLACGVWSTLTRSNWQVLLYSPYAWLIACLCGWGLVRTVPYMGTYRFDAIRDAVIYGYSIFALMMMAHLVSRPERLPALVRAYGKASLWIPLGAPLMWIAGKAMENTLPVWPWSGTQMGRVVKGGDTMVHLAGVLAFWVAYPDKFYSPRVRLLGLLGLIVGVVAVGSETRGGLLAFMVVFTLCFVAYPNNQALRRILVTGIVGLLLMAITGLEFSLGDRERTISSEQIVSNVVSMVGGSNEELDGTKSWRLEWWHDIINYTIHGKYFWEGKGFGINLADSDGYQVAQDENLPLRSPHNGHLAILARSGVIGLSLWGVLNAAWAWGVGTAYLQARSRQQLHWAGLFLFLFADWLAQVVNASFDVYLESPMGGIWFWSIVGVGMAAVWLYRWQPELLEPMVPSEVTP